MLTDYFSCYKQFLQHLKIVKFSLLLKFWGIQIFVFLNCKKKKSNILFLHMHSGNSAYHTGSLFTQHCYVCRVLFILNKMKHAMCNIGYILIITIQNISTIMIFILFHCDFTYNWAVPCEKGPYDLWRHNEKKRW